VKNILSILKITANIIESIDKTNKKREKNMFFDKKNRFWAFSYQKTDIFSNFAARWLLCTRNA